MSNSKYDKARVMYSCFIIIPLIRFLHQRCFKEECLMD